MNPVSDTAAQAAIGAAARELRLPTIRAQAARLAEIAADHLDPDAAGRWLALLRPAVQLVPAGPGDPVVARLGGTHNAFNVTALAQDLADLYGYQLSLVFDPTRVQFGGVTEGGFLATAGSTFFDGGTLDAAAGRVDLVFDTLVGPGAGANGSGDLATFRFTALQGGPAAFSLDDVLAIDSGLATIAVGTAALVLAVPEPSIGAVGSAGLFALWGVAALRRRRSATHRGPRD